MNACSPPTFLYEKVQKKPLFTKPIYLQTLSHNCDETYSEIDDSNLKGIYYDQP